MSKGAVTSAGSGSHGRSLSRSSRGISGIVSPTVVAASLRSVLSQMSEEELNRYKAAFQDADADADGYLNLGQAMDALRGCGVQVTSNDMLDSLDDLEVAQEDVQATSEWEQEQNRRRRRRRRHSLEQMEELVDKGVHGGHGTGQLAHGQLTAYDSALDEQKDLMPSPMPPPPLSRANSTGRLSSVSLENAPNNSSLKSPSIDISTFLNLAKVPAASVASPLTASMSRKLTTSATVPPPPRLGLGRPLGPPIPPAVPTPTAATQSEQPWEHAGFQASSNATAASSAATSNVATASGRPFANIVSGERSGSGTNSPRLFPTMRLRDHQPSLHSLAGGPLTTSTAALLQPTTVTSRRPFQLMDDFDDDFDFDPEQDLLEAFHTFDPNKTGQMSIKNLIAIMMNMGEKWNEEDALEMAEEIDQRREGRFNYEQLVHKVRPQSTTSNRTQP